MNISLKSYRRSCLLGAIGAFLMLVGDLCLVLVHMLTWQILFVLVPDIRQMCGARISTLDFVFSQGSGNAAFCIWMLILYFSSKTFWAAKTKNI